MPKAKIAITIDENALAQVDALVRAGRFASRSAAVAAAVEAQLARLRHTRLADACSLLDLDEERAMAEEGMADTLAGWPAY